MNLDQVARQSAGAIRETAAAMPLAEMREVVRYRRRWAAFSAAAVGGLVLVVLVGGAGLLGLFARGEPDVIEQVTTSTILMPETPIVLPEVAVCSADSTPNLPGPQDQVRPTPTEEELLAAVDYESGQLITHSLGRWSDGTLRDPGTWAFDLCANTWQAMEPEVEPTEFLPVLVYAAGSDLIFGIDHFDQGWTYDYNTDTWTQKGKTPERISEAVYDSASDTVVAIEIRATWAYDVDTDTWTRRSDLPVPANLLHSHLIAYDPGLDRVVAWVSLMTGSGFNNPRVESTWLYDTDSDEWTSVSTDTPWMNTGWGAFDDGWLTYHEESGRSVMFAASVFASFDGTQQTWTHREDKDLRDTTLDRTGHAFEYDPLNDRIVLAGGLARMDEDVIWVTRDDVWAYDPSTDEWTMLLAASDPPGPDD